ncbi:MAG: sulfite exporter TauE/SafE family protein, partial [Sulfolobales archaeon]
MDLEQSIIIIALVSLFASTVNGGLGYGYSSISVPILLLWYTNKQINPYLNIVEVFLNPYVLISNRKGLTRNAIIHALPVLIGLIPGIVVGVYLLNSVDPKQLKLYFYIVITPLILLQAAGVRKPIPVNLLGRGVGQSFGFGLGLLYSLTTISGPPLALLF